MAGQEPGKKKSPRDSAFTRQEPHGIQRARPTTGEVGAISCNLVRSRAISRLVDEIWIGEQRTRHRHHVRLPRRQQLALTWVQN